MHAAQGNLAAAILSLEVHETEDTEQRYHDGEHREDGDERRQLLLLLVLGAQLLVEAVDHHIVGRHLCIHLDDAVGDVLLHGGNVGLRNGAHIQMAVSAPAVGTEHVEGKGRHTILQRTELEVLAEAHDRRFTVMAVYLIAKLEAKLLAGRLVEDEGAVGALIVGHKVAPFGDVDTHEAQEVVRHGVALEVDLLAQKTASPAHAALVHDVAIGKGDVGNHGILLEQSGKGLAAAILLVDAHGDVGGKQMALVESHIVVHHIGVLQLDEDGAGDEGNGDDKLEAQQCVAQATARLGVAERALDNKGRRHRCDVPRWIDAGEHSKHESCSHGEEHQHHVVLQGNGGGDGAVDVARRCQYKDDDGCYEQRYRHQAHRLEHEATAQPPCGAAEDLLGIHAAYAARHHRHEEVDEVDKGNHDDERGNGQQGQRGGAVAGLALCTRHVCCKVGILQCREAEGEFLLEVVYRDAILRSNIIFELAIIELRVYIMEECILLLGTDELIIIGIAPFARVVHIVIGTDEYVQPIQVAVAWEVLEQSYDSECASHSILDGVVYREVMRLGKALAHHYRVRFFQPFKVALHQSEPHRLRHGACAPRFAYVHQLHLVALHLVGHKDGEVRCVHPHRAEALYVVVVLAEEVAEVVVDCWHPRTLLAPSRFHLYSEHAVGIAEAFVVA